eukprot:7998-Chlamydomonas_euryale.AAC.5
MGGRRGGSSVVAVATERLLRLLRLDETDAFMRAGHGDNGIEGKDGLHGEKGPLPGRGVLLWVAAVAAAAAGAAAPAATAVATKHATRMVGPSSGASPPINGLLASVRIPRRASCLPPYHAVMGTSALEASSSTGREAMGRGGGHNAEAETTKPPRAQATTALTAPRSALVRWRAACK